MANKWLLPNYKLLPEILLTRLINFWWPPQRSDRRVLVLLAIVALVAYLIHKNYHICYLFVMFVASQTITILITLNDSNGRYFFAVQPIFLYLLSIGLYLAIKPLNFK